MTAAELARRLEKEGVVVVSFFAGAAGRCGVLFPQLLAFLPLLQQRSSCVRWANLCSRPYSPVQATSRPAARRSTS